MPSWIIAALITAGLLAFALLGALIALAYAGRRTLGALLRRIDNRGWFSIGLFALAAAIFAMLAVKPALEDNKLFATLAQAIVITGLINMAAGFLFGASKTDGAKPPADQPPS